MTKRLLGITYMLLGERGKSKPGLTSVTWARGKFRPLILIYPYNICEFNDHIFSICNYAGENLLLVDAAATLPLAMPPILPSAYIQSLARPALILS